MLNEMRKERSLVVLFAIATVLVIIFIFMFFPRKCSKLIQNADSLFFQFVSWEYTDNNYSPISVECRLDSQLDEYDEIYNEILNIMDDYYYFVCPFSYSKDNIAMWFYIFIDDKYDVVCKGTNCVKINGINYRIYGSDGISTAMINEIYNLLKRHSLIEE